MRSKAASKCLNLLRGIKIVPSLLLMSRESLVSVNGKLDRKRN